MSDEIRHLRVDSVTYRPEEGPGDGTPDPMPTFRVRGVYLPTGEAFERDMALELDGRDAEETHVSGVDFERFWDQDGPEPYDLSEELMLRIGESEAYRQQAAHYHGE